MFSFAELNAGRAICSVFVVDYMRATTVVRPPTNVYMTVSFVGTLRSSAAQRTFTAMHRLFSAHDAVALDIPGSMRMWYRWFDTSTSHRPAAVLSTLTYVATLVNSWESEAA